MNKIIATTSSILQLNQMFSAPLKASWNQQLTGMNSLEKTIWYCGSYQTLKCCVTADFNKKVGDQLLELDLGKKAFVEEIVS